MDIILLERVEKLGQMGDVVKVKNGYARNFLLPQKKALRASKDNIAYFETQKAQLEAQNLERRQEAEAVAGKMNDMSVVLIRSAGLKESIVQVVGILFHDSQSNVRWFFCITHQ